MVRITKKELYIKVVYYGPGLSGKTTNLEVIHKQLPEEKRGDLTSIATETDRTIFFDCLPFEAISPDGRLLKLQLFTIPGQVYYKSTRQLILRGADGVVFVADSQKGKEEENRESFEDLCEILEAYRVDVSQMPLVFQYNKRDLPHLIEVDKLEASLNQSKRPSFCASAINRLGIMETMQRVLRLVMSRLRLYPNEAEEKLLLERRRRELYQKALKEDLSTAEWVEFIGLNLDPRRRGPVGDTLRNLKILLRNELKKENHPRVMELCEAIVGLDPGEHAIQQALRNFREKLYPTSVRTGSSITPPQKEISSLSSSPPKINSPQKESYPSNSGFVPASPPAFEPDPSLSKASQENGIQKIKKEISQNPENLLLRKKLINLYLKQKKIAQAEEELMKTIHIHIKRGNENLAIRCCEYLLKINPQNKQAQTLLHRLQG